MFDSPRTVLTLPHWLEPVLSRTGLSYDDIGNYSAIRGILSDNDIAHLINTSTLFQFGFIYNRGHYIDPLHIYKGCNEAEQESSLMVLAKWLFTEVTPLLSLNDVGDIYSGSRNDVLYESCTGTKVKLGRFNNNIVTSKNGVAVSYVGLVGHIYYHWLKSATTEQRAELQGLLTLSNQPEIYLETFHKLLCDKLEYDGLLYANAFNSAANHGVLFLGFNKHANDETTDYAFLNNLLCSDAKFSVNKDLKVLEAHQCFAKIYLKMLETRADFSQIASTTLYDGLCRLLID